MADGKGVLYGAAGTLSAAFIVGGVTLAMAQSALKTDVEHLKKVQTANAAAIATIPVTAEKIKNIEEDIGDIEDTQQKILDAIEQRNQGD